MRGESGSVFLDAVIAAAIVAMAVGMMYRAIGDTARRDGAAQDKRMALLVAQSELAAVGYEIPLESGAAGGRQGPYAWRVAMAPAPNPGPNGAGQLWQVTVAVSHADGGDIVSLQSLRLASGR